MRMDMSSRNKRSLVLAVAVMGLCGLGYYAYTTFRAPPVVTLPAAAGGGAPRPGAGSPAGPPGGQPLRVETARVLAAELALDATAVGSLRSNESVVLRPETAGRIASINFRDGVAVSKDSLAARARCRDAGGRA
jgi:membrane fusion protein (multidrug efflux system)